MKPKEIKTMPAEPPDHFSAFLDDMTERWTPQDRRKALSLLIDIYSSMSLAEDPQTHTDSQISHRKLAAGEFGAFVAISAAYYAGGYPLLHACFLDIFGMKLEMYPKSKEQYESLEGSAAIPIVNQLDELRTRLRELDTQPAATTPKRLITALLEKIRLTLRKDWWYVPYFQFMSGVLQEFFQSLTIDI